MDGDDGAEVVVESGGGSDGGADEGAPVGLIGEADEDEELAHETGGERKAGEGGEGDRHGEREQWGAFAEAAEVADVFATAIHAQDGEDEEGEHGHGQVGAEVEGDDAAGGHLTADAVVTGEGEHEVTSMADAGVTEEALHALLEHGRQAAEQDGQGTEDEEQGFDLGTDDGTLDEEGIDDSGENDKTGGLGPDGEEGGDGDGSALIDIGDPALERCSGDFEAKSGEQEGGSEEGGAFRGACTGEGVGDAFVAEAAGGSIGPGDAEDEHAGAQSAEDEVFDPGFEGEAAFTSKGDEDVEGDGDEFQRDEDGDEILGGGHPHHAGADDERDAEELRDAAIDGVFADIRGALVGEPEDDEGDHQSEAFVKHGQGVERHPGAEEAGEAGVVAAGDGEEKDEREGGTSDADGGDGAAGDVGREGLKHQEHEAQDGEEGFDGEDGHKESVSGSGGGLGGTLDGGGSSLGHGGEVGFHEAKKQPGAATSDEQDSGEKDQGNALAEGGVLHEVTGGGGAVEDAAVGAEHVNGGHHDTPEGKGDGPLQRAEAGDAPFGEATDEDHDLTGEVG